MSEENYYYLTSGDWTNDIVQFHSLSETPASLPDILKDHIGNKFWSPCYGEVTLLEVNPEKIIIASVQNGKKHTLGPDGKHYSVSPNAELMLFPDYESYVGNILGYKAWETWVENQKKRYRAPMMGTYFYIGHYGEIKEGIDTDSTQDRLIWESGNYFETRDEALEASKAIKETLAKFH